VPGAPRGGPQGRVRPDVRRRTTLVLSAVLAVLGLVLLLETALAGGGIGYLFGSLMLVAGVGRMYVSLKTK
jgi:uncharacterized membrane protein HdeD (DUF308 family)